MDDGHSDHWVKRDEAARILHCSVSQVRWFERHKRLQARRNDRGTVTYARTEVVALSRARAARGTSTRRGDRETLRETVNGELSSRAFELFAIGASLVEVVIATKLPPERVRGLYAEFLTPITMPSPAQVERVREDLEKQLRSGETGARQGATVHAFGGKQRR
jgi:hypothetical protein